MDASSPGDFNARLAETAAATEALLGRLLADAPLPSEIARPQRLLAAMRHAMLGGGKRLRPFLLAESAALFGAARARRAARRLRARMRARLFAGA